MGMSMLPRKVAGMAMYSALRDKLRAAPPLDPANANAQAHHCKICRASSKPFDVVDFNKFASEVDFYGFGLSGITIPYYRCSSCGFLFTNSFDDWSAEDFAEFIYNTDYIKVDGDYAGVRANQAASRMSTV